MAVALGLALLLTAACGGSGASGDDQRLTVLAAASLTEPFTTLAKRFEADHPGVDVVTSFDSSATLAAQVAAGAPADVVATADPRTMDTMVEADALAGRPETFAHNELALVVPPDNPAGIHAVEDLDRSGVDFVVCAKSAPCGALAAQVLAEHGVTAPPRSYEVDVKAVLTKVVLGEADAGLVYASDVVAAGSKVRQVPLPRSPESSTSYPIAVTTDSKNPDLAKAFVDLVRSSEGRHVLTVAGFTVGADANP
ncbi:MAG TPA: molybdate ABC transporter substrate-binding protein [Nocardioidaceae bacterium]|nr:molybdate ABC transporter substrate-binding protein [Nocardioidaceae bacterium]